jgi:hypothetical protein
MTKSPHTGGERALYRIGGRLELPAGWRYTTRIEHVNSSVKRCRIVKDRLRLWKQGVRDLVMELCCALHNFRVRLTPGQPMI